MKPSNVLLDEEGNAYLSDFGVALDEGSRERTSGTIMRGTPEYLSPEQVRLDPATPSSDIYALGIVAYEMLVGDRPVATSSHEGLLDRHLHEPLPSVRRVRPELRPVVDDVIARASAKEATDRFPDVLEAAAAFREAFDGTRSVRDPLAQSRNPYKGLRAFLEADAGDFFGREVVTERLVQGLAGRGRVHGSSPWSARRVRGNRPSSERASCRHSGAGRCPAPIDGSSSTCSPARTRSKNSSPPCSASLWSRPRP